MNTTALYNSMIEANAAFAADELNLEKLRVLEAAETAYYAAVAAKRAEWNARPTGDRKDSAEQNAVDTEGCEIDQLRWYEVALMTYNLYE